MVFDGSIVSDHSRDFLFLMMMEVVALLLHLLAILVDTMMSCLDLHHILVEVDDDAAEDDFRHSIETMMGAADHLDGMLLLLLIVALHHILFQRYLVEYRCTKMTVADSARHCY